MIHKQEALLKAAFTKELRRQMPTFLVLHYATAGAPDREIVGAGRTTRWECKHATPGYDSIELQVLTCRRLALADHCRYIFWMEKKGTKRTMILHPERIHDKTLTPETWCIGFDMRWLVDQVAHAHGL